MLAANSWKFVQELVEWMSSFQVVDQRLHRDTSPREDRCAAQALGRGSDQRVRQRGQFELRLALVIRSRRLRSLRRYVLRSQSSFGRPR